MVYFKEATMTRTTAPINPGDTVVSLSSTSGWDTTTAGHTRYLNMWGPGLSEYPEYTYTRTVPKYAVGSVTATSVTLEQPWSGAAVPAGTAVANGRGGGTYDYIAASYAQLSATQYERFEGTIATTYSGTNNQGTTAQGATFARFRYGTQFVRLMLLPNYAQQSSGGAKFGMSDFHFTDHHLSTT